MSAPPSQRGTGPVDAFPWPEQLSARLTTADESSVAGYDVTEDLATHGSFTDLLYLAAQGELPSERDGRVVDYVLTNLAPISIAKAPAHAASLVRLCDGSSAAATGTAYLTAAEEGRFFIRAHAEFFAWLNARTEDAGFESMPRPPTPSDSSRATEAILRGLDKRGLSLNLPSTLARETVLLAALHAIGVRDPINLEFFWSAARGALALGEALRVVPRQLKSYPLSLPRFEYDGDRS